jgi:hypothetical protein
VIIALTEIVGQNGSGVEIVGLEGRRFRGNFDVLAQGAFRFHQTGGYCSSVFWRVKGYTVDAYLANGQRNLVKSLPRTSDS